MAPLPTPMHGQKTLESQGQNLSLTVVYVPQQALNDDWSKRLTMNDRAAGDQRGGAAP